MLARRSRFTEIVKRSYRAYVDKDRSAIEPAPRRRLSFHQPARQSHRSKVPGFERCHGSNSGKDRRLRLHRRRPATRSRLCDLCRSQRPRGRNFRNTEVLTVQDGKIVEAEVYFGWNVPHPAPSGGFVEDVRRECDIARRVTRRTTTTQGRASAGPGSSKTSSARRCGRGSYSLFDALRSFQPIVLASRGPRAA